MEPRFRVPVGHYLLSHSVGCLPADAPKALEAAYFDPWASTGGDAWAGWLSEIAAFRVAVARLIGAETDAICPQTNLSGALSKILHALPERPGRTVLALCEEDFPSLGFVLEMARRRGLSLRFLPRGAAAEALETWEAALGSDVQLALVTHGFSNRSARLPVAEISRIARSAGVYTVVDTVQTAGVIPINVADWAADFVLGSCVKFLCGGPGAAWLWGRQETVAACQPLDTGWFSHADPFAFDIHAFEPAGGALRFWGGTPSVAPFILARHALELMLGIGVAAIEQNNQELIDHLHAAVPEAAIGSVRARALRANAVLLKVIDEAEARERLRAAGVFADFRDGAVRVSPHIYNSVGDIEALVEAVAPVLRR